MITRGRGGGGGQKGGSGDRKILCLRRRVHNAVCSDVLLSGTLETLYGFVKHVTPLVSIEKSCCPDHKLYFVPVYPAALAALAPHYTGSSGCPAASAGTRSRCCWGYRSPQSSGSSCTCSAHLVTPRLDGRSVELWYLTRAVNSCGSHPRTASCDFNHMSPTESSRITIFKSLWPSHT